MERLLNLIRLDELLVAWIYSRTVRYILTHEIHNENVLMTQFSHHISYKAGLNAVSIHMLIFCADRSLL